MFENGQKLSKIARFEEISSQDDDGDESDKHL